MEIQSAGSPQRKSKERVNNNYRTVSLNGISDEEMKDLGVEMLSYEGYCDNEEDDDDEEDEEDEECTVSKKSRVVLKDPQIYRRLNTNTTPHDVFSWLSDEMVLGILRHLSHRKLGETALVSRRFHRLTQDESLWRRLDLAGRFLPTDSLGYVLLRRPRVLRLAKSKISTPIFAETRQRLQRLASRIEYLDLSEATIAPTDLERLLKRCHDLKKLSLEGCELSRGVCFAIARNSDLDALNLALCSSLTHEGVAEILRNCRQLESLNMAWTSLSGAEAATVCRSVSCSIKELNLSGSTITDKDVERLVTRCSGLREVDFSDCWALTPMSLDLVVAHLSSLTTLSLSRCVRITSHLFKGLKKLPSLERLNVFSTRDGDASVLENHYPGVRINQDPFSRVARPTVGDRRTSIWQIRCRE